MFNQMFSQVVQSLYAGEFICQVKDHSSFSYLNDPKNQAEVNAHLGRTGLYIAVTRQGGAFFVAHHVDGGVDRKAAKEVFTEIKQSLRPVASFLEMLMRVMQNDNILMVGTSIEVNKLMGAIDANPTYRTDLQMLASQLKIQADGTDRNRLEKVLKVFRDKGYLLLANPEREIYQVTGKIEFFHQAVEFLMEHDGIGEDETPSTQAVLL